MNFHQVPTSIISSLDSELMFLDPRYANAILT